MATNLFHRGVDSRIITELENRRTGKTRIRAASFDVQEQERNGKYFPSTQRQAWVKIYDHTGAVFLAYGWDALNELNETYVLPNGTERLAYRLDTLETAIAGDYGSLRNFKLNFTINIRQPEKINERFDEIFKRAVDAFQIGKKICIQYGYKDFYGGYDKDVHHSPSNPDDTVGFNAGSLGVTDSEGKEITGEIYTVVKPEFTIASLNKIMFSVSGVGPGAQIGEKNISDSFDFRLLAKSNPGMYKVEGDKQPTFITNYDLDDDEGRYAPVHNIIDWIDFDVQSRIREYEGDDADDDFETKNGVGTIGDYQPPPVDPDGDYGNVGFVVFKFDEEYYTNPLQIDAEDQGDAYAYYVTLQYLTWLFNWSLQPRGIPPAAKDAQREQKKKEGSKDYYKYLIQCDKETSRADLAFADRVGGAITYVPSADPLSVIFNYGSYTTDPSKASTYGALMESYNWWYALAGAALGTVGTVASLGVGSVAAVGAGALIASMGYQENLENIISFSSNEKDDDQVHDALNTASTFGIQDKLSMKPEIGNLSNILINRDCIAGIFDEMGALKRTKEKEDEEVSKVTVEKFFKKLFEIIKSASGGTIQLKAVEDPDNTDPFINKLLIINENAPPSTENIKVPVFNKNDGSVIEMSLKSKIPKAMQVAAATQGDSNIEDIENQENPSDNETEDEVTANPVTIASEKDGLVKNKFASANVKSFSALLSKFVNRENSFSKTKVNRKLTRFPLTMTLVIQGITGFKFGDTITSQMLPPKYREEIINKGYQTDVIFTVTKVTQQITGNSWTTTLDTVMRFAPGTKTTKIQ